MGVGGREGELKGHLKFFRKFPNSSWTRKPAKAEDDDIKSVSQMKRETLLSADGNPLIHFQESLSSWMIRHCLFRNTFTTRTLRDVGGYILTCEICLSCDSFVSWTLGPNLSGTIETACREIKLEDASGTLRKKNFGKKRL